MAHVVFLTVGIGAGLSLWLFVLAPGYLANPAPLPFGLFYPIFHSSFDTIAFLVAVGYFVRFLIVRKTKRNIRLTLLALIGLVIASVGPKLFNSYDAFIYRMKGFSEAEFQRLAADIKTELDERGVDRLPKDQLYGSSRPEIPESLTRSHPIIAISDFPIDIAARGESIRIMWASGLTGGYVVAISLSANPPSGWADGLQQGVYNLPVTYIYDGVALSLAP